jgi:hypothetical protein
MSQLLQLPWIKLVCAVHCLNSMVKYFIVVGLIYLHNSVVLCAFLVLASCIKLAFVKNLEPKRLWVLAMVQLLYTWAPFKHQRLCRLYCKFMLKPEFMQCVWLAGVCLTLLDVGFLPLSDSFVQMCISSISEPPSIQCSKNEETCVYWNGSVDRYLDAACDI